MKHYGSDLENISLGTGALAKAPKNGFGLVFLTFVLAGIAISDFLYTLCFDEI